MNVISKFMVCAALGLLGSGIAAAQTGTVYKWVDRNGVTHFTDIPPETAAIEDTGIDYRLTDPAAVQARVSRAQEAARAGLEQSAGDAQQAEQERRRADQDGLERGENCDRARERLEAYATAHRLYRQTDDGERAYLTDAEIDAARENAAADVSRWCN